MPTAKSPDSAARLVVAKIGAGAPEIVSEEVRHFYEWLTEEIAGVRCSLGDFVPCFTVDDLDQRPDLPARLLKQAAVEADGDHNLTIFVHLQAAAGITVPSNCENFLLHTIRELAITTTSTDRLFILLREELPPEGDVFRRILQDVAHSGQVVILDKTGSSWPPAKLLRGTSRILPSSAFDSSKARLVCFLVSKGGHVEFVVTSGERFPARAWSAPATSTTPQGVQGRLRSSFWTALKGRI